MGNALSRVMDQAAEAAGNFPADNDTGGRALAPVHSQVPATRPSLDSMADSAGIQVDEFLTVKDGGFRLADQKGYFSEARVRIDMTEVVPIISVRATRAGSTTFIKSYDGVMTSQGQNFEQATANLRGTYDKVDGPYQTAEIPVLLLEDVTDVTANKSIAAVTVRAGLRIGITPSITAAKFFTTFYNQLRKQGLQESVLDVTIRHKYLTNKNGNEWGAVEFVDAVEVAE